jgi:hypothetical protein
MKRRCESSARGAKRAKVASFLMEALPVNDVCNIILDYSVEFEGRRTRELKLPWLINTLVELYDGNCTIVVDPFWAHLFIFETMQKNRDFENV